MCYGRRGQSQNKARNLLNDMRMLLERPWLRKPRVAGWMLHISSLSDETKDVETSVLFNLIKLCKQLGRYE